MTRSKDANYLEHIAAVGILLESTVDPFLISARFRATVRHISVDGRPIYETLKNRRCGLIVGRHYKIVAEGRFDLFMTEQIELNPRADNMFYLIDAVKYKMWRRHLVPILTQAAKEWGNVQECQGR